MKSSFLARLVSPALQRRLTSAQRKPRSPRSSPVFVPWILPLLFLFTLAASPAAKAQTTLPFEVSNPARKKWSPAEAGRIYSWACQLLAKTIRPENPPQLHPHFRLVLGADSNMFVRDGAVDEIRLKAWDPNKFAEGVVAVAIREVVQSDEQARLARRSVMLANSTLDAHEHRGQ